MRNRWGLAFCPHHSPLVVHPGRVVSGLFPLIADGVPWCHVPVGVTTHPLKDSCIALTICVQFCVNVSFHFSGINKYPGLQVAGLYGSCVLSFLGNCQTVFQSGTISVPPSTV